jgi:hypothetical protein
MAAGIRRADHATPFVRRKLTLTSPTSGGRSVGIVRSRTEATEFLLMPYERQSPAGVEAKHPPVHKVDPGDLAKRVVPAWTTYRTLCHGESGHAGATPSWSKHAMNCTARSNAVQLIWWDWTATMWIRIKQCQYSSYDIKVESKAIPVTGL